MDFYGFDLGAAGAPEAVLAFLVGALSWGFIAGGLAVVLASVASRRSGS